MSSTNSSSAESIDEGVGNVTVFPSHAEKRPEMAPQNTDAVARDAKTVPGVPQTLIGSKSLVRGTELGRYLVLELLGSGGLGEVYLAYDPDLDRKVAVKLLHSTERSRQGRLMREAQALAKLSHPNVVTIYDVGTFGEQVYIAMELVEGSTLRDWWRQRRRSWKEIRDALVAAGHGLRAAHGAGLVHRDFKPENVLVGHDGRVYVLDFGLARVVETSEAFPEHGEFDGMPSISRVELIDCATRIPFQGTPAYMAPEQFGFGTVDTRTDQFGFCVTLFEALFDRRPFAGGDLAALLDALISERFCFPDEAEGRSIPAWLRRVITKGLSAAADDRFESMDALLYALQEDRRNRSHAWKVGVGLAAFMTVASGAFTWMNRRPTAAAVEQGPVAQLTAEAYEAAAKAFYVYPPLDDPAAPTAYLKVLELERLQGMHSQEGGARGEQLRHEFASTLVRLGDHYWERPGGAPFASDYYAWALIFDAEHPRARERVGWTTGQLETLRRQATERNFTIEELAAMQPLVALAEASEQEKVEGLVEVYGHPREPSLTTSHQLERLLGTQTLEQVRRRAEDRSQTGPDEATQSSPPEGGESPQEPATAEDAVATEEAAADPRASSSRAKQPGSTVDRIWLREQLHKARQAFDRGQLDAASALYHGVLTADRGNVGALMGLAEVSFERGAYQKATQFAERAAAAAPKRASVRLLLGDCYFKVLRYSDARRQYEQARALGHRDANSKLKRLEQTLGGKSL